MLPCMIWYFTWRKLREKRGIGVTTPFRALLKNTLVRNLSLGAHKLPNFSISPIQLICSQIGLKRNPQKSDSKTSTMR